MVGIIGYGCFIPYLRIKVDDIREIWRNYPLEFLKDRLGLTERAVLQPNEDVITLAIAASKGAMESSKVDRKRIDALYLGTCTNPYDSRPSSTVVAEALGVTPNLMCGDVQFAGKSGTAAIQICMALVKSKMARCGLAIGSDALNRHACPGRLFEYEASAGAAAFVIGEDEPLAEIEGTSSHADDTAEFWRIEGDRYIQSTGLSPGSPSGDVYPMWEVGYVNHVTNSSQSLMQKLGTRPEDYNYAVFQQPFGSAPYMIMERLGFTRKQVEPGTVSNMIGDCGAASALLGLANVLDSAKPGERIFVASHGFGSGSDALSLRVTSRIDERRQRTQLKKMLERKQVVNYAEATRNEYKYLQDLNPTYL
jgi:3-hydroxy-3-methylglutaryl CoA synthase